MGEAFAHGVAAAPPGAAAAAAHFERLRRAFDDAVAGRPAVVHDLALAGMRIRLRFAGPALTPAVLPPLRHLVRGAERPLPDATILVWDSESTGVPAPAPAWRRRDLDARWEVRGYNTARFRTHHDPEAHVLTMVDTAMATGIWWTPSPAEVPWYDRAAPLKTALHWAVTAPGRHLLHAGAVAGPRGALLFVGRGGSGKSTTALLSLAAGFRYLGDDYVLLADGSAPTVHSIFGTAKITAETVRLLPDLARAEVVLAAADKTVVDVARARPSALLGSAPVAGVVVPSVERAGASLLEPLPPAEALRALAQSTVLQLPHEASAALATMAGLVRGVPCYRLTLGADPGAVPRLLRPLVT